jgi:hypothetical protein
MIRAARLRVGEIERRLAKQVDQDVEGIQISSGGHHCSSSRPPAGMPATRAQTPTLEQFVSAFLWRGNARRRCGLLDHNKLTKA